MRAISTLLRSPTVPILSLRINEPMSSQTENTLRLAVPGKRKGRTATQDSCMFLILSCPLTAISHAMLVVNAASTEAAQRRRHAHNPVAFSADSDVRSSPEPEEDKDKNSGRFGELVDYESERNMSPVPLDDASSDDQDSDVDGEHSSVSGQSSSGSETSLEPISRSPSRSSLASDDSRPATPPAGPLPRPREAQNPQGPRHERLYDQPGVLYGPVHWLRLREGPDRRAMPHIVHLPSGPYVVLHPPRAAQQPRAPVPNNGAPAAPVPNNGAPAFHAPNNDGPAFPVPMIPILPPAPPRANVPADGHAHPQPEPAGPNAPAAQEQNNNEQMVCLACPAGTPAVPVASLLEHVQFMVRAHEAVRPEVIAAHRQLYVQILAGMSDRGVDCESFADFKNLY